MAKKFGRACPKCSGTGTVRVSLNLSPTLAALSSGSMTLTALQKKLKVGPSTINSRVMRLMTQGLVTRSREGKGDYGPTPYVYHCAAKEM